MTLIILVFGDINPFTSNILTSIYIINSSLFMKKFYVDFNIFENRLLFELFEELI